MTARGGYLESIDEIPEPHAFTARVSLDRGGERHAVEFAEHEHAHGAAHRDNNMRAAIVHVLADAAVSVLVIVGLSLGAFSAGPGWIRLSADRRHRHRRLVLRADPRYRRHPARHESRPQHGRAHARDHRDRRRSLDRPASVAARPRPSGRDPIGRDATAARTGLLSVAAAAISPLSHVTVQVQQR